MISKISILVLAFVSPCLALAGVDAFMGRPVLIQELDAKGTVKNQYLDSFQQEQGVW